MRNVLDLGFLLTQVSALSFTSSSLVWCIYTAKLNSNYFFMLPVQEKSMYDASHELQYLNMVIEETLRMYPPAPVWVHYSSFLFLAH